MSADDLSEKMMKLNEETLEQIADDIFNIESIEDLAKYLKQWKSIYYLLFL